MRTIGQFYKERVLSLQKKDLCKRTLPDKDGLTRVEKDLFGWKLYYGKEAIECKSELEARYLKIFIDSYVHEILIPKDEEYLRVIVPELEKLKARIDQIIDDYTYGILDRSLRERVRQEVFQEITKEK